MVNCAYDLESPHSSWLERCAKEVARSLPGARVPFAFRISRNADGLVFHEAYHGVMDDAKQRFAALHAPLTDAQLDVFFRPGTVSRSMKELLLEAENMPAQAIAQVDAWFQQFGGEDVLPFGGMDARGHGVIIGAALDRLHTSEAIRRAQLRVGVHFNAAMRLREQLGERAALDLGEAVLETNGRLAHAEGEAKTLREALTRAVEGIERAKSPARRDDDDALQMWQGLVEGRWSLVDHIDSDGRRYYVAVANPAAGVSARALTPAEQQVVAMAVSGEPNKVIAYALGLTTSTVGVRLSMAMRKLGVSTRTDLIRVGKRLME